MEEPDLKHRINNIQTAINMMTGTISNPAASVESRERAESRRRVLTQEVKALQHVVSQAGKAIS